MKNQKESKRSLKNYIIPIVLSILILGILGVFASTTLSNNPNAYLSADNLTINGSGAYLQNGANLNGVSSGTADVVVCRGTSIWDDYYKSIKWMSGCNVVCKSTDDRCNNIIQTALNSTQTSGGVVRIRHGRYPINISKDWYTNVYGSVNSSLVVYGGTSFIGDGMDNTELYNIGTVLPDGINMILQKANGNNASLISDLKINLNAQNLIYGSYSGNHFVKGIDGSMPNTVGNSIIRNIKIINGDVQTYSATTSMTGIGINTYLCPECSYDTIYLQSIDYPLWITRAFASTITRYHFNNIWINDAKSYGIYFEQSDSDIFSNINIFNSNWSIRFSDGTTTNLILNNVNVFNTTGRVLSISGAASRVDSLIMDNFIFDTSIDDSGGFSDGIQLSSAFTNSSFSNGKITNMYDYGINSVGYNIKFSNIVVSRSGGRGVFIDDASKNNYLYEVESFNNSQSGFNLQNGICSNCISYNNAGAGGVAGGFRLDGTPTENVVLISPVCYNNTASVQTKCVDIYTQNVTYIYNPIIVAQSPINFNGATTDAYISDYLYTGAITYANYPCATTTNFNEKTIHNSTTNCMCTGGAWKCWAMT